MLGFTLSKMNLLILVMALFAIVTYFMFSLGPILIGVAAQKIVSDYAERAFNKIETPPSILCASEDVLIPESIRLVVGERFFYLMRISQREIAGEEFNTLIFSIAARKNPKNILAAESIDANVIFKIYKWDGQAIGAGLEEDENTLLDPQSAPLPKDMLSIIKEVHGGETYLYIIPCSSAAGLAACELNKSDVGCKIFEERRVESSCIPVDDKECCRHCYNIPTVPNCGSLCIS